MTGGARTAGDIASVDQRLTVAGSSAVHGDCLVTAGTILQGALRDRAG